jgi:hypothetical protein
MNSKEWVANESYFGCHDFFLEHGEMDINNIIIRKKTCHLTLV